MRSNDERRGPGNGRIETRGQLTAEQLADHTGLRTGAVHSAVLTLADRALIAAVPGTRPTTWELSANGLEFARTARGRGVLDIPPRRRAAR